MSFSPGGTDLSTRSPKKVSHPGQDAFQMPGTGVSAPWASWPWWGPSQCTDPTRTPEGPGEAAEGQSHPTAVGQINSWPCRSSRVLCRPRLGHHSQGGRALVQDGQGAAVQSTPTRAPQVATRPQRGGAEPTRDPQPFRFLGRVDTVTAPVPSPPCSHPVWSPEPPVGIAPLPSPHLQRPLSGEDALWRQCPPAPGMLAWSHWVSRWTRPVRWQGMDCWAIW